jgi:LL-diaminopimelate aminotransferase
MVQVRFGNILDIFGENNVVAVLDPVYPACGYQCHGRAHRRCGSVAASRGWFLPTNADNNFVPELPRQRVDLIYLCYPNNPTGVVATGEMLKRWVEYAHENGSIILFYAAYEAYITDPSIPHSIYEIDGARSAAIEFRSFSKTEFHRYAVRLHRCSKDLEESAGWAEVAIHPLWNRRHPQVQWRLVPRATRAAIYSPEGKQQVRETIGFTSPTPGCCVKPSGWESGCTAG